MSGHPAPEHDQRPPQGGLSVEAGMIWARIEDSYPNGNGIRVRDLFEVTCLDNEGGIELLRVRSSNDLTEDA